MENAVLLLRKAMDLTQQEFAAHFQCSLSSVQGWEKGRAPSEPVIQDMSAVARERGLSELAGIISALSKRSPLRPSAVPSPTVRDGDSTSANPYKHREAHDLLEDILNSGDPDAIPAVLSNLHVFGKYVKKELTKSKKKG